MAGDKLRIDYKAMADASRFFLDEAHEIDELVKHLAGTVEELTHRGWSGETAQAFTRQLHDVALPATEKLSGLLSESGNTLVQLARLYQDTDQQVAALFKHGSSGSDGDPQAPGGTTELDKLMRQNEIIFNRLMGKGTGRSVDINDYKSGTEGWSLISTDGSKGFVPSQLVSQIGGTCALYAPLNLLIESGYADKMYLSQAGADTYVSIKKIQEARWIDLVLDRENGFPMDVTEKVIADHTPNYQRGDFSNATDAENFLVKTVQGGKPVLVSMQVDDSFGMSGAHDATVVGVQTGPDGKLQNVLLATNWKDSPVYEIPAKDFMDDWMNYKDGQYITVDRAPVVPKPAPDPNGFSATLARELDKEWGKPTP